MRRNVRRQRCGEGVGTSSAVVTERAATCGFRPFRRARMLPLSSDKRAMTRSSSFCPCAVVRKDKTQTSHKRQIRVGKIPRKIKTNNNKRSQNYIASPREGHQIRELHHCCPLPGMATRYSRRARSLPGPSTQDDLARSSEVGVVALRRFERGVSELRRAILAALRPQIEPEPAEANLDQPKAASTGLCFRLLISGSQVRVLLHPPNQTCPDRVPRYVIRRHRSLLP